MNQTPRGQQPMRQAPNARSYPSRRHPNDVAPPAPPSGGDVAAAGAPAGPTSQAWTSPFPAVQGLAAAQGYAARLSATAGLLFGGLVIAAIALFMPWVTVSVDSPLGGSLYKVNASPFTGGGIFAVLLVIAGAAWLAWPLLSGSLLPVKRLWGLTAAVGVQIICLLIGFGDYANGVGEKSKVAASLREALTGLHVSIEFGLLLYAAAVVAITVGLVRIWIHRSHAAKRAS
jgi:hypothetical protein